MSWRSKSPTPARIGLTLFQLGGSSGYLRQAESICSPQRQLCAAGFHEGRAPAPKAQAVRSGCVCDNNLDWLGRTPEPIRTGDTLARSEFLCVAHNSSLPLQPTALSSASHHADTLGGTAGAMSKPLAPPSKKRACPSTGKQLLPFSAIICCTLAHHKPLALATGTRKLSFPGCLM